MLPLQKNAGGGVQPLKRAETQRLLPSPQSIPVVVKPRSSLFIQWIFVVMILIGLAGIAILILWLTKTAFFASSDSNLISVISLSSSTLLSSSLSSSPISPSSSAAAPPVAATGATSSSGPQKTAIVILSGQSNMAGGGGNDGPDSPAMYALPQITQIGTWPIGGYSTNGNDYLVEVQAIDPLEFYNSGGAAGGPSAIGYTDPQSRIQVGPGMSFAYSYYQETGQSVILVPCAVGGTGFLPSPPVPDALGYITTWTPVDVTNPANFGYLYYQCWNLTQTLLNRHPTTYELKAILWSQGENNAQSGSCSGPYADCLQTQAEHTASVRAVINQFRSDFNNPTLPFVQLEMMPPWVEQATTSGAEVQRSITLSPFEYNYSSVVYGFDYEGVPLGSTIYADVSVHYNVVEQRLNGIRMNQAYFAALQNYPGSTIPGVIVQTAYDPSTLAGTSISIGFPPDPIAISYEVSLNGIVQPLTLIATPTNFMEGTVNYSSITGVSGSTFYLFMVRGIGPTSLPGRWSLPNNFTTLPSVVSSSSSYTYSDTYYLVSATNPNLCLDYQDISSGSPVTFQTCIIGPTGGTITTPYQTYTYTIYNELAMANYYNTGWGLNTCTVGQALTGYAYGGSAYSYDTTTQQFSCLGSGEVVLCWQLAGSGVGAQIIFETCDSSLSSQQFLFGSTYS